MGRQVTGNDAPEKSSALNQLAAGGKKEDFHRRIRRRAPPSGLRLFGCTSKSLRGDKSMGGGKEQ